MSHELSAHRTVARAALTIVLLVGGGFVAARLLAQESPTSGPSSSLTDQPKPGPSYSIQQLGDSLWLLAPNGERFFSLGVCCVNRGTARDDFDPENPSYAAWQHYPEPVAWADEALRRLKTWRFSTIGGWSDFQSLRQSREMSLAFTPVLHVGSTAGAPWWDMWDPKVTSRMEETAREQILAVRDDPRLIGYYSDNEIGWWNATLFKMTLEQIPTSGQRRQLIELLHETYDHDWDRLLEDFEPEGADSWEQLDERGTLYLRPGGHGIRVMRQFLSLLAERYYSLVHDIIHKYDSRALILGDRYQSFYYPEVARAAASYVDVASTNLNASWNDGTFLRFYLETLHALTGKPILVSEFYMAAQENHSGNKNNHGVFPVVRTQTERAACFRNTLMALLRIPYVIGADWFQYYDEATHGRFDGENFNFGLVDIHDEPYAEITAEVGSIEPLRLKSEPRASLSDASQGVPRAPPKPMGQFRPMRALRAWDRERGFVKPLSEFPLADLYICWNDEAVYLGLYSLDVVEDAYYRDRLVPKSDRAEWTVCIGPDSDKPIRARLGAGREPIVSTPAVRVVNLSALDHDVRNIACMQLPARLFSRDRFHAGETIEFSSTLLTHCQAYRVEWQGKFELRNE